MTGIKDRERENIRTCLEHHPVLMVRGPEWTGVVRATEAILDLTGRDAEDRESAWGNLHPDLTVYDGRGLPKDEAKDIREHSTSMPVRWKRRFIIVPYIDRPHREVMPVLLKLIEEPPQHFSVIVTTSNDQRVLPTILSRSLRVNVAPSDEDEVRWWLQLRGKDQEELRVRASGGDLDVAENLDLAVIRSWQRDWSDVFAGEVFRGDFPLVWSNRLEGASESTHFACWNLLIQMTVLVLIQNKIWSDFGLVCLQARDTVRNGEMNKMMASNFVIRVFAIATTIFKRGR